MVVPRQAERADIVAAGAGADDTEGGIFEAAGLVQSVDDLVDGAVPAHGDDPAVAAVYGGFRQLHRVAGGLGDGVLEPHPSCPEQFEYARPGPAGLAGPRRRIDD